MITRLFPVLASLALALAGAPAHAQFLYKSTMPDGRVVYGDSPAAGAVKVEKTRPDTSDKGVRPPTEREAATLRQMQTDRAVRESPDQRRQLEEALRNAQAQQAAGKEPLPNERIGTAGGASRLTDAYFERQKSLAAAVEQARRNLEAGQVVAPPVPAGSAGATGGAEGAKGFDTPRPFK